ncbi:MAG TPA: hypothetical protein VFH90_00605 [Candidatus Limnocylindria bacterium]|nr:hypothetical protein [Candidatus Limnocylindria bacterium]
MRPSRRVLATLAGTGLLFSAACAQPISAAAFSLSGCQLTLTSFDADGTEIDSAIGGSPDATQQDPLRVSWGGEVRWTREGSPGSTGNRSWHVDIFGLPTMLRGTDSAAESDVVEVGGGMPFRFTGLFYVSGRISGPDLSCSGSGWVRVLGDPLSTLPFTMGLSMLLIGLVLLAVGARGRWLPAVLGGAVVGMGAAILSVIYATVPMGEATPAVLTASGIVIGVAAGWHGSRQRAAS